MKSSNTSDAVAMDVRDCGYGEEGGEDSGRRGGVGRTRESCDVAAGETGGEEISNESTAGEDVGNDETAVGASRTACAGDSRVVVEGDVRR